MTSLFRRYLGRKEATAAIINLYEYAAYHAEYETLATVLGHSGSKGSEDELRLVQELLQRRPAREGSVNLADTLFLAAMTSILSPRRVIEIGTGTGFSSALITRIMQHRSGMLAGVCVETIDACEYYRGDEAVRTGEDIPLLIPDCASSVRAHSPRQSDFVDQLAQPNELEFGFIDANHQHPCPLLDMLRLARVTRPGGWIALHDIELGTLVAAAERAGKPLPFRGQYGAEWLFEKWPFGKVRNGNIGAIQLPSSKRKIRRVVKTLLKLPFEIGIRGHRRFRREIMDATRVLVTGG